MDWRQQVFGKTAMLAAGRGASRGSVINIEWLDCRM